PWSSSACGLPLCSLAVGDRASCIVAARAPRHGLVRRGVVPRGLVRLPSRPPWGKVVEARSPAATEKRNSSWCVNNERTDGRFLCQHRDMRTLGDVLVAMVTCGDRWPSIHAELVHRYDPGTAADARRALRAREGDRPADQPGPPASGAETGTGIADGAGTADGGGAPGPRVAAVAFVPAPAAPASGEEATDPVVRRGRLLAAAGLLCVEWPDEDEVTVVNGEHWRRRRGEAVSGTGTVGAAPPGTGPDGGPGLAWAGRRL